ncbi:cytochrome C oxidase Cbb3 [Bdellovibrio bacteriovorus]|uniref:cytochrome-c oxidase n=2 Tax=Bdellovibrio bacteriovorus TaxID=959 RepID=A0A150WJB4_BDEBC|nr:cytochrome-c oxidase, cbb3-type subunit I [Bdellovibrio bacteriovorus]KYG63774.1 cytochrome C oxidase Cbb3 [Bdellovibrio bacteriovorus]
MKNPSGSLIENIFYDDDIVKKFVLATMIWAGAAFLFGLIAAIQLAFWPMNLNLEWVTFGRLRPLHTNAAIFAFAGNAIFAGIYHSSQRLLKTRMFSDTLSRIHFWGWQLIIVAAAITLPLGYTQSKEYAELEWPIDIAITLIWVVFAVNFFMTIRNRREKHLYVALWFYIATIITVAVLHIVNSIEIPVSFLQSYPVYAGIQDAMVQWWYGHNAVAFFLTTPFLGLMYYYVPKAANRPVYSYRLSIIHFWALVFIYIWAGPHHLLYTSLPDWAQTLGMIFSLMLWAPSWGGMINGLLTLKGSWHLLRTEPLIKFFVAALTFYGMATFEGPLLSIKSVSALGHYTDWIVGHVHSGALGWNGFLTFGMIYFLVPRLWNTTLYSKKLLENHFWIGLTGILFYYISMVVAGITQGMMWRAIDKDGNLVYPDFIETVVRIVPLYWVRALGGLLFIIGFLLMCYNIYMTIRLAPKAVPEKSVNVSRTGYDEQNAGSHRKLEGMGFVFSVLAFLAILVGSVIEIYPTLSMHKYVNPNQITDPYTPLELAGRDVYLKEGCYVCHSQQIRPIVSEVLRYGKASTIEESMYDRPFQWGSKRTGPDLARVGKKYPNLWHLNHMIDPRSVTPKSIMPNYPWLLEKNTDFIVLRKKLSVMKYLGVPYDDEVVANADIHAQKQAQEIAADLEANGAAKGLAKKEIVALIAYLQALGQKGKQ